MKKQILIVGSGFSGMWAAVSAARLNALEGNNSLKIAVLAPAPELRVRPRFYEENVTSLVSPLTGLFAELGIDFIAGKAEFIDIKGKSVSYRDANGVTAAVSYERLVLATGSQSKRPPIAGLAEYAFDIDQLESLRPLSSILTPWSRALPPLRAIPWLSVAAVLPALNWQPSFLPDCALASVMIQRQELS